MEIKDSYTLYQNHDDRFFAVTCKGLKNGVKKSNYTLRIPHGNLSKTIQYLHQQGATITNVTLISPLSSVENESNSLTRKSSLREIKNSPFLTTKNLLSPLPLTRKLGLKKRKLSRFSFRLTRRDKSRLKNLRHKRKHN